MNDTEATDKQLDLVRKLKTLDAAGACALDAPMLHAYAGLDLDLILLALLAYRDQEAGANRAPITASGLYPYPPPTGPTESGPNPAQLAALAAFAGRHGRTWKAALRIAWETGADEREPEAGLLRQIRNQYGPAWLTRFQFSPE